MEKMEAPIDPNEEAEKLLTKLTDGIERAKVKGVPVEELDSVLQELLGITGESTLEERLRAINAIQGDKEALINLRGLLAKLAPDMIVPDEVEERKKRKMSLPLPDAICDVYRDGRVIAIDGQILSRREAMDIALNGNGKAPRARFQAEVILGRPVTSQIHESDRKAWRECLEHIPE